MKKYFKILTLVILALFTITSCNNVAKNAGPKNYFKGVVISQKENANSGAYNDYLVDTTGDRLPDLTKTSSDAFSNKDSVIIVVQDSVVTDIVLLPKTR